MSVRATAPQMVRHIDGHVRAFIQVQNGCDHRCTFCIIPYGRGNSRSVPAGAVIDKIKTLVDAGYREVVLTGVDVTSYGPDLPGEPTLRSEEHTSELQSLMRISYAVFCLKKKQQHIKHIYKICIYH